MATAENGQEFTPGCRYSDICEELGCQIRVYLGNTTFDYIERPGYR